jgi:hypothetical protein
MPAKGLTIFLCGFFQFLPGWLYPNASTADCESGATLIKAAWRWRLTYCHSHKIIGYKSFYFNNQSPAICLHFCCRRFGCSASTATSFFSSL